MKIEETAKKSELPDDPSHIGSKQAAKDSKFSLEEDDELTKRKSLQKMINLNPKKKSEGGDDEYEEDYHSHTNSYSHEHTPPYSDDEHPPKNVGNDMSKFKKEKFSDQNYTEDYSSLNKTANDGE